MVNPIGFRKHGLCHFLSEIMDNDGDMDIVTSVSQTRSNQWVRWLENPGKIEIKNKSGSIILLAVRVFRGYVMDMADYWRRWTGRCHCYGIYQSKIVYMKRLNKNGLKWKSYTIDILKSLKSKAVKVGDIGMGMGNLDLVHYHKIHWSDAS